MSSSAPTISNPSPPSTALLDLFSRVQSHFPADTLGSEGWIIITLSVFTSTAKCHLAADLYKYLITLPQYATSPQRQALMRRLREVLVKLTSIIGVGRPLETVINFDKVTAPEDRDYSFSRKDWKNNEASHERGVAWLKKLYGENLSPIYDMFESHKDFGWISSEITYGLYLSDHSILNGVETELVVLSGMLCSNMSREMGWHLRGSRRIGISSEDCEKVQQCVSLELFLRLYSREEVLLTIMQIEMVVEYVGVHVVPMPRVKDIEHEV